MRLLALILLFAPLAAQARVFDFKDSSIAAYLRGIGGMSAVGQEPFGNSCGQDTKVSGETKYQYGGELGFQFAFTDAFRMRLGAEMIQHRPVLEGKGTNPSGVERFEIESDVFIFNPNVTFEYAYKAMPKTKTYVGVGMGMADITIENRYKMTATGSSELGVSDFNEKIHGVSTSFHALIGFETAFVDNATFSLDAGYRYLQTKKLTYKAATNNIVNPSGSAEGDPVLNHDGTDRRMDLGGLYFGATLKFYLNFL